MAPSQLMMARVRAAAKADVTFVGRHPVDGRVVSATFTPEPDGWTLSWHGLDEPGAAILVERSGVALPAGTAVVVVELEPDAEG